MNFAQMLMQGPTLGKQRQDPRKHMSRETYDQIKANTFARYCKAIGDDWSSTREIETRLGLAVASSYDLLNKWAKEGKLERRYRIPGSAKSGVQWRVLK